MELDGAGLTAAPPSARFRSQRSAGSRQQHVATGECGQRLACLDRHTPRPRQRADSLTRTAVAALLRPLAAVMPLPLPPQRPLARLLQVLPVTGRCRLPSTPAAAAAAPACSAGPASRSATSHPDWAMRGRHRHLHTCPFLCSDYAMRSARSSVAGQAGRPKWT